MFIHAASRKRISLDGVWGFTPDPMDAFGEKRSRSIQLGVEPLDDSRPVEYSPEGRYSVEIPGDWNTGHDSLLWYEGTGWYSKRIELDLDSLRGRGDDRVFFCTNGVNYKATLFCNGEMVGDFQVPFVRQALDVTGCLRNGSNFIAMRVDSRRAADRVPGMRYDWWNYGGCIGSLYLCAAPSNGIADASVVTLRLEENGRVHAAVLVSLVPDASPVRDMAIRVKSADLGVDETFPVQAADVVGRFALNPNDDLVLWSPETPALYRFDIECLCEGRTVDHVAVTTGFRIVETRGDRVLLNGKPVFLKGVALHDERIGADGGRTRSMADAEALLDYAGELGCNFVRLAHYPFPEYFYDLCDRHGFLVWDEIPVYWRIDYGSANAVTDASVMFENMLKLSRGHPCVFCHALANETWEGAGKRDFLGTLRSRAVTLDPHTPLSAAIAVPFRDGSFDNGHKKSDCVPEFIDIAGVNEYGGWYVCDDGELAAASIKTLSMPTLVSEFGAAGSFDVPEESSLTWSLERQADVINLQFELFDRTRELCGVTVWVLKDFRSPLRANCFQRGWNRKGLLDENGRRKKAFDVVRNRYSRI